MSRHRKPFACSRCTWEGVLWCNGSRCPVCGRPLRELQPAEPSSEHAEILRLRAIVRSLAERVFVQAECLERVAERSKS